MHRKTTQSSSNSRMCLRTPVNSRRRRIPYTPSVPSFYIAFHHTIQRLSRHQVTFAYNHTANKMDVSTVTADAGKALELELLLSITTRRLHLSLSTNVIAGERVACAYAADQQITGSLIAPSAQLYHGRLPPTYLIATRRGLHASNSH